MGRHVYPRTVVSVSKNPKRTSSSFHLKLTYDIAELALNNNHSICSSAFTVDVFAVLFVRGYLLINVCCSTCSSIFTVFFLLLFIRVYLLLNLCCSIC